MLLRLRSLYPLNNCHLYIKFSLVYFCLVLHIYSLNMIQVLSKPYEIRCTAPQPWFYHLILCQFYYCRYVPSLAIVLPATKTTCGERPGSQRAALRNVFTWKLAGRREVMSRRFLRTLPACFPSSLLGYSVFRSNIFFLSNINFKNQSRCIGSLVLVISLVYAPACPSLENVIFSR